MVILPKQTFLNLPMTPLKPHLLLRNCSLADCSNLWNGETVSAAIIIQGNSITWIGNNDEIPVLSNEFKEINVEGRLVTAGLIDCHTHIIYAGDRSQEYALRLEGKSYQEIAMAGGGILSTVTATREADEETLFKQSNARLNNWIESGFTSIEIKSGYGLDFDSEIKMLKVADRMAQTQAIEVHPTLLAAHTVPPEFNKHGSDYIDWIINQLMPEVSSQKLATAVDVFCESIGFTNEQSKRLFESAKSQGFNLKIHAEQLSNLNGCEMAAKLSALSADHLEFLEPSGIEAMKQSGTVAVLLPIAYYFLKETQLPPIQALKDAQINIAIGSDSNPGSAPTNSPLLALNMATTLFGLTPTEALKGMTINAAKALGVADRVGSIEVGKQADIAIWDLQRAEELSYWIGGAPLYKRIYRGKFI